jgi:hypothetical protein
MTVNGAMLVRVFGAQLVSLNHQLSTGHLVVFVQHNSQLPTQALQKEKQEEYLILMYSGAHLHHLGQEFCGFLAAKGCQLHRLLDASKVGELVA